MISVWPWRRRGEYENAIRALQYCTDAEGTPDPLFGPLLKALENGAEIASRTAALKAVLKGYRVHRDFAAEAFREAVEFDSGYALAYAELGMALAEQGAAAGALNALRQASALDADFRLRYARLVQVLEAGGDIRAALGAFQLFLEGIPALFGGDIEKARRSFEASLELDEQFALSEVGLGLIAISQEDEAEAKRHFLQAMELDSVLAAYWGKSLQAALC